MSVCLEIAGSGGIRSQRKKRREALLCCHHGQIHGEVRGENVMKAEIGGFEMVIGVFGRGGAGSEFQESWQQYVSGRDNTGEFQSPTFLDENPRHDLNWLCLAMILLKTL